jgi:hypothetical protein
MVNTNLAQFMGPVVQWLAAPVMWAMLKTSAQGAATPLWLATSDAPEVVGTGGYFGTESSVKPGPSIALESSEASRDPALVWSGIQILETPTRLSNFAFLIETPLDLKTCLTFSYICLSKISCMTIKSLQ